MIHSSYQTPAVIHEAAVCLEQDFLEGSLDKLTVESTGQEVETYDYNSSTTQFNHEWE